MSKKISDEGIQESINELLTALEQLDAPIGDAEADVRAFLSKYDTRTKTFQVSVTVQRSYNVTVTVEAASDDDASEIVSNMEGSDLVEGSDGGTDGVTDVNVDDDGADWDVSVDSVDEQEG